MRTDLFQNPVAYPVFSRWGASPERWRSQPIDWPNCPQKLYKKERSWTKRVRVSLARPQKDLPMITYDNLCSRVSFFNIKSETHLYHEIRT